MISIRIKLASITRQKSDSQGKIYAFQARQRGFKRNRESRVSSDETEREEEGEFRSN